MRMPYRTKLAERREALKQTLDFFRFETRQGILNEVTGTLAG